jgi:hypothetical protein
VLQDFCRKYRVSLDLGSDVSFALPTNLVHISARRDFLVGRVRLRPNRNRRANFDVRGFAHERSDTRLLLKISDQPRSRLRRSFALPTNFVHISARRDFLVGRVRLRPNRSRRSNFDVRGFSDERSDQDLQKIPRQPRSRLRRSFALPTNFAHLSERRAPQRKY